MIDHAEVREQLELAALEPGGLDRLAAGDTSEAAAIAGHLAGCPSCSEEARRLAEVAPVVREIALEVPPADLRDRTLALVREVGRPRGAVPQPAAVAAAPPTPVPATTTLPAPVPVATPARGRFRWPVTIAAVVAILVIGASGLVAVRAVQDLRDQAEALAELNDATLQVTARADAARVDLAPPPGTAGTATGTLVFSPSTAEIVISAPGLARPAGGQEYACWVSQPDGTRKRIGKMEFGGGLAYWAGWSDELHAVGPGSTFGVSLVEAESGAAPTDVLVGTVSHG